jgi:hypothetical protein
MTRREPLLALVLAGCTVENQYVHPEIDFSAFRNTAVLAVSWEAPREEEPQKKNALEQFDEYLKIRGYDVKDSAVTLQWVADRSIDLKNPVAVKKAARELNIRSYLVLTFSREGGRTVSARMHDAYDGTRLWEGEFKQEFTVGLDDDPWVFLARKVAYSAPDAAPPKP